MWTHKGSPSRGKDKKRMKPEDFHLLLVIAKLLKQEKNLVGRFGVGIEVINHMII